MTPSYGANARAGYVVMPVHVIVISVHRTRAGARARLLLERVEQRRGRGYTGRLVIGEAWGLKAHTVRAIRETSHAEPVVLQFSPRAPGSRLVEAARRALGQPPAPNRGEPA